MEACAGAPGGGIACVLCVVLRSRACDGVVGDLGMIAWT
jgi:hypothetical protein